MPLEAVWREKSHFVRSQAEFACACAVPPALDATESWLSRLRAGQRCVTVGLRSRLLRQVLLLGEMAQQKLQTEFDITFCHNALNRATLQFLRQGQVRGDDLP